MVAPLKYLKTNKFISISHTSNIVNTSWTKFHSSRPFWFIRSYSALIIVSCSFLQFSPELAAFLALTISPCTSCSGNEEEATHVCEGTSDTFNFTWKLSVHVSNFVPSGSRETWVCLYSFCTLCFSSFTKHNMERGPWFLHLLYKLFGD